MSPFYLKHDAKSNLDTDVMKMDRTPFMYRTSKLNNFLTTRRMKKKILVATFPDLGNFESLN